MKTRFVLIISSCFLGMLTGIVTAASDGRAKFTPVLEMMLELGLPDTKGAKYGKVEFTSYESQRIMQRYRELELSGNAWLLPGDPQQCVYEGAWKIDYDAAQINWSDRKLETDLKKVIKYLEKKKYEDYEIRPMAPNLLFLATHAHRNGYSAEANRITRLLCDACNGSRYVAAYAITELANTRTAEAVMRFQVEPDFAQLAEQLDAVLEKYTDYWARRPAVALLLEKVRSQPADITLIIDEVAADFSTEDRALLAGVFAPEFSKAHSGLLQMYDYTDWVMNPPQLEEGGTPSPLFQILTKGMDAIPLLAVLLEVESLTPVVNMSKSGYTSHNGDPFNTNQDSSRLYNEIFRPSEAREIAASLLDSGMKGTGSLRYYGNQPAHIFYADAKKMAMAFYEQNYGKDSGEILAGQLDLPDQREDAVDSILRSDDPELLQVLKAKLLEWPVSSDTIRYTINMLRSTSGEMDTAFLEQFRQRIPEDLDTLLVEYTDDFGYPEEYRDQLRSGLQERVNTLDQLLNPPDMEDVVSAIAQDSKEISEPYFILQKNPQEALPVILKYVLTEQEPLHIQRVTNALYYIADQDQGRVDYQAMVDKDLWNRAWLHLFEMENPVLETTYATNQHYVRLCDVAVGAFGQMIPGGDADIAVPSADSYFTYGSFLREEVRQQMLRYLKSGKTEGMPVSMDEVPEERRQSLQTELEAVSSRKDLDQLLESLTPSELLLSAGVIAEDEALKTKFHPLANTITKVVLIGEAKTYKGIPQVGDVFDQGLRDRMVELCKASLRDGKPASIRILRSGVPEGLYVSIEHLPPGDDMGWMNSVSQESGDLVFGSLSVGDVYGHYFDIISKKASDAESEAQTERFGVSNEQFELYLEEFVLDAKGNSTHSFELVFYALAAPNDDNPGVNP